jgi:hypothetical protein
MVASRTHAVEGTYVPPRRATCSVWSPVAQRERQIITEGWVSGRTAIYPTLLAGCVAAMASPIQVSRRNSLGELRSAPAVAGTRSRASLPGPPGRTHGGAPVDHWPPLRPRGEARTEAQSRTPTSWVLTRLPLRRPSTDLQPGGISIAFNKPRSVARCAGISVQHSPYGVNSTVPRCGQEGRPRSRRCHSTHSGRCPPRHSRLRLG